MSKKYLILFSNKNKLFLLEKATHIAALFSGGTAEKPSHAIFHALRAIKSSHFANGYFLRKISITNVIGDSYMSWTSQRPVIIHAPMGTGKTYFILNVW